MKYIRVENNEINGNPRNLPVCWGNITNFHLLDNQKLKEHGWYPFEEELINLSDNEVITGWSNVIENDRVIRRATKRLLTQDEINYKNEQISDKKWIEIRQLRNRLLAECDWTQLQDVQLENRGIWASYRQVLRDLTKVKNPEDIIWPTPPPVIITPPPPPIITPPPVEEDAL